MVSFIYNGSEKTTWMGGTVWKPKAQIPKQYFKDKNIFSEFQAADH